MLPGTTSVPRTLGGVKMPSDRSAWTCARHHARSASLAPQAASAVSPCGTSARRQRGIGLRARRLFARDVARRARVAPRRGRAARPSRGRAGTGGRSSSRPRRRRTRATVALGREERGRRRDVVVPEVVVHGLEVPRDLAGRGAQRDDRVGEAVVAGSQPAVVVGARAAGRHEHQVAPRIRDDARPRVGAARARVVRQRVERPAQRAAAGVERAHLARDRGRPGGCPRSPSRSRPGRRSPPAATSARTRPRTRVRAAAPP